jgi:hypothetical protein
MIGELGLHFAFEPVTAHGGAQPGKQLSQCAKAA